MNTIAVSLFVLSLACVSMGKVLVSNCPRPDDRNLNLEENSTRLINYYNKISGGFNMRTNTTSLLSGLEKSDECEKPKFPNDDQTDAALTRDSPVESKPEALDFLQIPFKKPCEPCPAKQHFLSRFYGNCYVITPNQQQVRYVTCNRRCFAPCMCSRSFCQRTAYVKVWFFSYCVGNGPFYGGYQQGLNFRYQWLPQDCTCVNV